MFHCIGLFYGPVYVVFSSFKCGMYLFQSNLWADGCHEPVILYQCLANNWRLLLTHQSSSMVEFYSWAVWVCRELWWNGDVNSPSPFTKGHFEWSLCGGMSPSRGVSPSTQLVGVADCWRPNICSQVPSPGSGTPTVSGLSIPSLDLGVETLWGDTRIMGGVRFLWVRRQA